MLGVAAMFSAAASQPRRADQRERPERPSATAAAASMSAAGNSMIGPSMTPPASNTARRRAAGSERRQRRYLQNDERDPTRARPPYAATGQDSPRRAARVCAVLGAADRGAFAGSAAAYSDALFIQRAKLAGFATTMLGSTTYSRIGRPGIGSKGSAPIWRAALARSSVVRRTTTLS